MKDDQVLKSAAKATKGSSLQETRVHPWSPEWLDREEGCTIAVFKKLTHDSSESFDLTQTQTQNQVDSVTVESSDGELDSDDPIPVSQLWWTPVQTVPLNLPQSVLVNGSRRMIVEEYDVEDKGTQTSSIDDVVEYEFQERFGGGSVGQREWAAWALRQSLKHGVQLNSQALEPQQPGSGSGQP